jgi:hypothetical protein
LLLDDGRPRNRFAHSSHGIIGHDGADPAAIRTAALQQLSVYPTVERHEGTAVEARRGDGDFTLRLEDGSEVSGRRLILASGVADRLPEIDGAEERWGITVLHCPYCHGWEVRDRPLGVLATSAGSANFAALLPDWGPTTYFTQGEFDPDPEQASLLELRGVTVEPTPIEKLLGSPPALAGVRLADGRELPLEAMFAPSRWSFASPLAGSSAARSRRRPTALTCSWTKIGKRAFRASTPPATWHGQCTTPPLRRLTELPLEPRRTVRWLGSDEKWRCASSMPTWRCQTSAMGGKRTLAMP